MKLSIAALLAILVGALLGGGTAMWRLRQAYWDGEPVEGVHVGPPGSSPPRAVQSPKVSVDQEEYDFGTMDSRGELSHDFIFTNTGGSKLVLKAGATSCRCAVSEIQQNELPPGQSGKATLRWKTREAVGPYRQTATIHTNDPNREEVKLAVFGQVTTAVWAEPAELVLGPLSSDETATAQTQLLCSLSPSLEIVDYQLSDQQRAKFFQVTLKPLPKAQWPAARNVQSGLLLTVAVKPGLPQGTFQQTIVLKTNVPSRPELSVSVKGTIGSDISVVGDGWDPGPGMLNLGFVSNKTGIQRRLLLVAHGPHCKEVKFKAVRIDPDLLAVTVGETKQIGSGAATQTPLLIRIPPGSRPANHLGSDQGKLGEIVLETDHPRVSRLRILVRFLIEGD